MGQQFEELLSANTAFVASFSEEDDLLSQWRGYCPNGSGFAICLSSDHVHALAKADGWMLLKCSYSEEEQRSAIEGIERLVIDAPAASQVFATFLLSMGIAFKHRKFGEEKECRAIKLASQFTDQDFTPLIRQGRFFLVPYVDFHLTLPGEKEKSIPLDAVVVGPNPVFTAR
jgi:hypothetical protein